MLGKLTGRSLAVAQELKHTVASSIHHARRSITRHHSRNMAEFYEKDARAHRLRRAAPCADDASHAAAREPLAVVDATLRRTPGPPARPHRRRAGSGRRSGSSSRPRGPSSAGSFAAARRHRCCDAGSHNAETEADADSQLRDTPASSGPCVCCWLIDALASAREEHGPDWFEPGWQGRTGHCANRLDAAEFTGWALEVGA